MKNLKKLLVVVLVVAMVLSIGAISASAAFTDTTTNSYKSAIDLLAGIGVIGGTTPTTFAPADILTRESAAKIIAYMLAGPANAALLGAPSNSRFTDVAKDRWSAPFIEYCANAGVIGGVGNNKFNPEGKLSTAAFTKMLLCAVGYKADAEGLTGDNWASSTASLALSAGIYDSTITISTADCTRAQAAQLAYKALMATLVSYTGGSTITIGGTSITTGATRSNVVSTNAVKYDGVADNLMQFCERYFPNLAVSSAADDFGRPNTATWVNGVTTVATFLPTLTKTYTKSTYSGTIFTDLGLSATKTATTYTDGSNNVGAFNIVSGDTTNMIGGNGTLTEVYYDTTAGTVKIVVINTYYGTIGTVTTTVPASVTITPSATAAAGFVGASFVTTGLAVATPVYYTVAQTAATPTGIVKSVAAATKATITATQYTSSSVTAGGTTYSYSKKNVSGTTVGDFVAHDVYLDSYGYIIYVTGTTSVANYAVVLLTGSTTDAFGTATAQAKLLYTDGTTKAVTTDLIYDGTGAAGHSAADLRNKIVTFALDAYGRSVLTVVAGQANGTLANATLNAGLSAMTLGAATYYGNADTIFLVNNTTAATYTAYTGIANTVSVSSALSATYAEFTANGFARIVYISDAGTAINGASASTIYLTGTYTQTGDSTVGTYYLSQAVVNGTPTTVKLIAIPVKGLYTGITYNSNNIGTIGTAAAPVYTATGTTALTGSVIGLGAGAYFTTSSDCVVYYVSAAPVLVTHYYGIASASSVAGILTDANDTVIYTKNTSGLVNAIYIQIMP